MRPDWTSQHVSDADNNKANQILVESAMREVAEQKRMPSSFLEQLIFVRQKPFSSFKKALKER